MPKTIQLREKDVASLQKQLEARLKDEKIVPSAEFQAALKTFFDEFVKSGKEIDQVFTISGYKNKIHVMLRDSRQSMIMLQK